MQSKEIESSLVDPSRRIFLKSALALSATGTLYANNKKDSELLHLIRNGREYKIPFMREGKIEENGYNDLCRIFADVRAGVAVQMDPNLFVVLAQAQQWLSTNHINRPIILTSGYRTEHTNATTEGAAFNSMHLYGKAADIKIEGLPADYLARLLRLCGGSGIGIYSSFVHVDTWKERAWRG
ncbi:MAG: YcbK family protein [Sulfuricurvum sp.]|uniref:YcbK family protein n=1 Tax=Sulfuricurvum sp. TaxID=2025608 RepID=UPI0025F8F0C4|nr:DUF882 domain-containing protein [Sulfuricurvum sp.]MBV5320465.1 YcbK family protein [Sulfuricurvum sp.]